MHPSSSGPGRPTPRSGPSHPSCHPPYPKWAPIPLRLGISASLFWFGDFKLLPRSGSRPQIPFQFLPFPCQVLGQDAITFFSNPCRDRSAFSLRRGSLGDIRSRLRLRIAPPGMFLHYFLTHIRGQVEITHAASLILITQELVRVLRHALWPPVPFPRSGHRGVHRSVPAKSAPPRPLRPAAIPRPLSSLSGSGPVACKVDEFDRTTCPHSAPGQHMALDSARSFYQRKKYEAGAESKGEARSGNGRKETGSLVSAPPSEGVAMNHP